MAVDVVLGAIPFAGDAFDLRFKANTRNLNLMRRYLDHPDTSTRREWLSLGFVAGILIAVIDLFGWLVTAIVTEIARMLG